MEELKADVEELQRLNESATRQRVKDILNIEIRKLQTEIIKRTEDAQKTGENASETSVPKPEKTTKAPSTRYTKTLMNYAWDQSDKFMKIYVSLDGVQNVDKANVTSEFTNNSFRLSVADLAGTDYRLGVVNLFEDIIPASSYHKVKTDMVLVMLKKAEEKKTWAYVTQQEKKSKEKSKPKVDEKKDPNDSLMDMLKNMYDEGDDEMKRTIAKAWTESRNKNPGGDL